MAVMVSLNAVPAICVAGVGTVNELNVFEVTVKLPEVPAIEPWVAVSVVLWALTSVIEGRPTPKVKFTVAG
jgi:hypothetical protein